MCMKDEYKLSLYCLIMDNFFKNEEVFTFINSKISFLLKLISMTNYNFLPYNYSYDEINDNYLTSFMDENISFVSNFCNKYGIEADFDKLIKDNTLRMYYKNMKPESYKCDNSSGYSSYDDDNKKYFCILKTDTLKDSLTLIHEYMHYLNQPEVERNLTSGILTESISYGMEYIFFEDLLKEHNLFNKEINYLLTIRNYSIISDLVYNFYRLLKLYKAKNDITKKSYKDYYYNDGDYDEVIDSFERLFIKKDKEIDIYSAFIYIYSIPLSIYFLEEYKKNHNFIYKIIKLSNSINTCSLEECLKIVDINDEEDFLEKVKVSLESFNKDLDCLIDNNDVVNCRIKK